MQPGVQTKVIEQALGAARGCESDPQSGVQQLSDQGGSTRAAAAAATWTGGGRAAAEREDGRVLCTVRAGPTSLARVWTGCCSGLHYHDVVD